MSPLELQQRLLDGPISIAKNDVWNLELSRDSPWMGMGTRPAIVDILDGISVLTGKRWEFANIQHLKYRSEFREKNFEVIFLVKTTLLLLDAPEEPLELNLRQFKILSKTVDSPRVHFKGDVTILGLNYERGRELSDCFRELGIEFKAHELFELKYAADGSLSTKNADFSIRAEPEPDSCESMDLFA